jgi:hypothetical protein
MKKIIFIVVILLSVCGCKKDNSSEKSSDLIGEWSWISTCGLAGTDCKTPASTHSSHNLIFTSDSLFYVYQNDTLKISSVFHAHESGTEAGILKYGNDSWNADSFTLTHDTLTLVNLYGFIVWVNQYYRIKP